MSELARDRVRARAPDDSVVKGRRRDSLLYKARGAEAEICVAPCSEAEARGLLGSVWCERAAGGAQAALTVELLDQLGVVATASPCREGSFRFDGLESGVYHLRISDGDWKVGIFGLTV